MIEHYLVQVVCCHGFALQSTFI